MGIPCKFRLPSQIDIVKVNSPYARRKRLARAHSSYDHLSIYTFTFSCSSSFRQACRPCALCFLENCRRSDVPDSRNYDWQSCHYHYLGRHCFLPRPACHYTWYRGSGRNQWTFAPHCGLFSLMSPLRTISDFVLWSLKYSLEWRPSNYPYHSYCPSKTASHRDCTAFAPPSASPSGSRNLLLVLASRIGWRRVRRGRRS